MHDIWNPWHGCTKISEGCSHCYMFFLDKQRNKDGSHIYKTKSGFSYPLQKNKKRHYKIKSGELIRVCMTSDFFLKEADNWRNEVWEIMKLRSDVKFFLLTKRPERVEKCLPNNWGDGWENVFFNVSCENQKRADQRIPILLDLPFKHKGIMTAPMIGDIQIADYLKTGQIEQVIAGGENYNGARPCHFEWIKSLQQQCIEHHISFCFIETGSRFVKDDRTYNIPKKSVQSQMAFKSGVNYSGKHIKFALKDTMGFPIEKEYMYQPQYRTNCETCGSKPICNGCSNCGKCK